MDSNYDVVIIGGGAAGMMAGAMAAENGGRVVILEKNRRLGAKLAISGGGRCNITHATFDRQELLKRYGQAAGFLQSPFAQFGVEQTFEFFENNGLSLVTEARNRVFPSSQRATDVVNFFERRLKALGVEVVTDCQVLSVEAGEGRMRMVRTNRGNFSAASFVLATGGLSHPETGSTGDGFEWLRQLGHTVRQPTPSIVPVATREKWSHRLSGKAVEAVVWLSLDGQRQAGSRQRGRVLFTHFGLSGPTILNMAASIGQLLESDLPVQIHLDLLPGRDEGVADQQLLELLDSHKNKDLKTALRYWLPVGIGGLLMEQLKIDGSTKVHSLSRQDRKRLIGLAKDTTLTVSHLLGFDRAVVADGGLSLEEVDTRSMRSRLVGNLFVVGDLLDIRRPSGGYSLQLCWTTGYVAGVHLAGRGMSEE